MKTTRTPRTLAARTQTPRPIAADPSPDRAEILSALNENPRRLPSRFFYDQHGAELFDAITRTQAYYPTRVETGILRSHAHHLSERMGTHARIVEFGTGSGIKTRILLDAAAQPATYIPIDVACAQLELVADSLRQHYPGMEVLPLCADYTRALRLPAARAAERRTVIFFPGSTIGNMEPDDAFCFLRRLGPMAGPDGLLIVGVDCKKDRATLELAYNDPEGVTAEFNRNILSHVNHIAGSDFDLEAFQHYAFYNEAAGRIEMRLIATSEQTIHFPDPVRGELRIRLNTGEPIVTEHSYKYTIDELQGLARAAGYTADDVLTDADENFAVHVLSGA